MGVDLQKDIGKKNRCSERFQFLMAYNIFIAMLHTNKSMRCKCMFKNVP